MAATVHPVKPRDAQSRHAAYLALVNAVGGFKIAANILNRSATIVHAWGDPDSGREPPVWAVEALTVAAECPAMAEHLARLIGALVIPPVPEVDGEFGRSFAEVQKDCCDVIKAAADHMADGIVTPTENRDQRVANDKAINALHRCNWLLDVDYRAHNQKDA